MSNEDFCGWTLEETHNFLDQWHASNAVGTAKLFKGYKKDLVNIVTHHTVMTKDLQDPDLKAAVDTLAKLPGKTIELVKKGDEPYYLKFTNKIEPVDPGTSG